MISGFGRGESYSFTLVPAEVERVVRRKEYCSVVDRASHKCRTSSINVKKMGRKFFVGGNWKMNGTKSEINDIVAFLKTGPLDSNVGMHPSSPSRLTLSLLFVVF